MEEKDIRHKILVIKINKLYQRGMDERELYDIVRGAWRISKKNLDSIEYVFGVYNSLIVAVYKPTAWYVCNEVEKSKLPREDIPPTNRFFFLRMKDLKMIYYWTKMQCFMQGKIETLCSIFCHETVVSWRPFTIIK